MNIVAIVQARTGSTRLPGKVLRLIQGAPMLSRQLERVQRSRLVDLLVGATTNKEEDAALVPIIESVGCKVFLGSESDVLDRFYHAAKEHDAGVVVRLTGDCPLHDPEVIDETIQHFLDAHGALDYTSTPRNYPEGLDCEVFTFAALEHAWKHATLPSEREHVTPYIKNHTELFAADSWVSGGEDNASLHWSVDTEEDFRFVEAVYRELHEIHPAFGKNEVLALLTEKPELTRINTGGTGYEGLAKSLEEDDAFLHPSV